MNVHTINEWATLVLSLTGIVTLIIGAIAGSRFGKSKALDAAKAANDLIRQVAEIAVHATEQTTGALAPLGSNAQKLADATGRAQKMLGPTPVNVTDEQLSTPLEAAVKAMKIAQTPCPPATVAPVTPEAAANPGYVNIAPAGAPQGG